MEFKEKTEMRAHQVTVVEQIERELVNYSGAAVILVPKNDMSMRMFYRSGQAGGGGAWWQVSYNTDPDRSFRLRELLEDVTEAVLITREDVNNLLSGALVMMDPEEM